MSTLKNFITWTSPLLIGSGIGVLGYLASVGHTSSQAPMRPLVSATLLAVLSWMALLSLLVAIAYRGYQRHIQRDIALKIAQRQARDVFTLHPGTKALIDIETREFVGYCLPSGRIVHHRFWHELEGVKATL